MNPCCCIKVVRKPKIRAGAPVLCRRHRPWDACKPGEDTAPPCGVTGGARVSFMQRMKTRFLAGSAAALFPGIGAERPAGATLVTPHARKEPLALRHVTASAASNPPETPASGCRRWRAIGRCAWEGIKGRRQQVERLHEP
jgi:hypothetical protein